MRRERRATVIRTPRAVSTPRGTLPPTSSIGHPLERQRPVAAAPLDNHRPSGATAASLTTTPLRRTGSSRSTSLRFPRPSPASAEDTCARIAGVTTPEKLTRAVRSSAEPVASTSRAARSPATVDSASTAPAKPTATATPRTHSTYRPGRRRSRAAISPATALTTQPSAAGNGPEPSPGRRRPTSSTSGRSGCANGRRTPSRTPPRGRP